MSSADGWNKVVCQFYFDEGEEASVIRAKFSCYGKFWDRLEIEKSNKYELVDDFENLLQNVLVSGESVSLLVDLMETWLLDYKCFKVNLTKEDSFPSVTIGLQQDSGFITTNEKPVFELAYKDLRIQTTVRFIIDQTCVISFNHGLKRFLKSYQK